MPSVNKKGVIAIAPGTWVRYYRTRATGELELVIEPVEYTYRRGERDYVATPSGPVPAGEVLEARNADPGLADESEDGGAGDPN